MSMFYRSEWSNIQLQLRFCFHIVRYLAQNNCLTNANRRFASSMHNEFEPVNIVTNLLSRYDINWYSYKKLLTDISHGKYTENVPKYFQPQKRLIVLLLLWDKTKS